MTPPTLTAHRLARLLLKGPDLPVVIDGDMDGVYPANAPVIRWWKPGIRKAHQRSTHLTKTNAQADNAYEDDKTKPVEKVIAI